MKTLNRTNQAANSYPIRVLQFGEGNFLRAFVDWIIWKMNQKGDFNAGVAVVQPIANGMIDMLNEQNGLYHLVLKGLDKGEAIRQIQLIDVIQQGINPYTAFSDYMALADSETLRFVISNTTEAGITLHDDDKLEDAPATSYPAKLTQLLYRRFNHFKADKSKGLIIIPCELINYNADKLKECILTLATKWALGADFIKWIEESNYFCNTLVDRIVPGYPRETIDEILTEIGSQDKLVVEGEIFHLWVIEAAAQVQQEFPADRAGLNVLFVDSIQPYRDRKVTLLNGPHTVLSPVGYLSGLNTVRECCQDSEIGAYIHHVIYNELIPTLNLPKSELVAFADDIMDRFNNPYVKHQVTSIMLNSFSKYKTRDLPSVVTYLDRQGELPKGLVLGLAGIITYYKGGKRGDDSITPNDDAEITTLLSTLWSTNQEQQVAKGVLAATFIWGEDLNNIAGLTELLTTYLTAIQTEGMRSVVKSILQ